VNSSTDNYGGLVEATSPAVERDALNWSALRQAARDTAICAETRTDQKKFMYENATKAISYEFDFTARDYRELCDLVSVHTGIALSDQKQDLVYSRLSKRLRALGLTRFSDYCEVLRTSSDDELEHFVNAITTNLTNFFREEHHFDHLKTDVLPALLESYRDTRRIRIWSAGCSTGEEPYSIAIALREAIPNIERFDIRILATDLDSDVLRTGLNGVYPQSRIEGVGTGRQERWFEKGKGTNTGKVRVAREIREMISFRKLNLLQSWPMSGMFDVIFCRNVLIYFDKDNQSELFDRFANILQPNGTFFIGHSETTHGLSKRFRLVGKTTYMHDGE